MPIDVKCPQCGTELEAPDNAVGKKVKCPDCGNRIPIPAQGDEESPTSEDAIQETAGPRPAGRAARPEGEEVQEERPRRRPREEAEKEERPRRRRRDDDDDGRRRRREEDEEYADDGVSSLIPYKNGRALASYYCGVFSIIPCLGLVLGPLALIFGIQGLRLVNKHPTAKGTAHAWVGIVLGTLTLLANWITFIAVVALGGFAALKQ
jgi:Domain of unknown function (DUF4190)